MRCVDSAVASDSSPAPGRREAFFFARPACYHQAMRVAAIQHDIAWEDKAANHATVERLLDDAAVEPGTFVLLPEMGDTGFSFNLDVIVDDRTLPWAKKTAQQRRIWLQAGYAVRHEDGSGRNCATIVNPEGAAIGTYQKVHPFSFGREAEHFTGGGQIVLRRCGEAVVCPLICYDLRFPELFRLAALHGAEVFTIGANWPSARQAHWQALLRARAIENQAYVVGLNRVGDDPQLSYLGGSMIIGPTGEVLAEGDDRPAALTAELDLEALRAWRKQFPALQDVHRELLGTIAVDAGPDVDAPATVRSSTIA